MHVPHYCHMFEGIMAGPRPWRFGHVYLPGGSEALGTPAAAIRPLQPDGRCAYWFRTLLTWLRGARHPRSRHPPPAARRQARVWFRNLPGSSTAPCCPATRRTSSRTLGSVLCAVAVWRARAGPRSSHGSSCSCGPEHLLLGQLPMIDMSRELCARSARLPM